MFESLDDLKIVNELFVDEDFIAFMKKHEVDETYRKSYTFEFFFREFFSLSRARCPY